MKKIIVGILTFVFLFTGVQSVFASGPFNGQSGDCNPGIGIGVYPGNIQKDSYGCWSATSITANPGDTINVAMYYHNNTASTLTNVGGKIIKSSAGPSNTFTFTGTMSSDQGSTTVGTVTLNLPSSQTLTYSSTHWMKNAAAIQSDIDTSVFYNDGGLISIGSVPAGWSDYGEFLVVYKISNTVAPQLCTDPNATNYNGPLPCQYPPQLCKDTNATNYNGPLPCTYPQLCKDTTALNYNGPLPCQYPPQLCKDTNATNYNGPLPCQYSQPLCSISNFYANPTTIISGGTSTLSWNTSNCTSATIFPILGTVNTNDSKPVSPPTSTTYTLIAYGATGAAQSRTVIVSVNTAVCKDSSASNYNGPLPCQYPPQLCKDTNATNYNGPLPCTYPQLCKDTTALNYNGPLPCQYPPQLCRDINAINYNGALPCQYSQPQIYCQDLNAINYRGSLPCQYPIRICQDPSATNYQGSLPCNYYTRICQDPNSINYRGSLPCYYPQPQQLYCQDTSAVNYRGSLPCQYLIRICQDLNAANYNGALPCQYIQQQNFCQDPSATNYQGSLPCNYISYVNKNVVTTVATNITKNEAQINGYITNSTYYNSNVYFEYGTTVNLGSRTTSRSTSGNSSFSEVLSGLSPNTIYFFQAISNGNGGLSKGSIEIFRTLAEAAPAPIIIQGRTIIGTASPIQLLISNKSQLISAGDLVDYSVTYKNIGHVKLIRPMVQVVIPSNMTLVNSSRGTYSIDTHTLSAPIEDLEAGQEGAIYLQAKVDSIPINNAQIVTTAILVYTSPNGSQENAMTYVINVPSILGNTASSITTDGSVLGGSAFFGGFLSIGLIGWLLIILLIMIIILVSRSYNRGMQTVTHTPTH